MIRTWCVIKGGDVVGRGGQGGAVRKCGMRRKGAARERRLHRWAGRSGGDVMG